MASRAGVEFGGIRFVADDWPILLTVFPAERVPDDALHSLFGQLESSMREALGRREKVFFISDLTEMRQITPASQRQIAAEFLKKTTELAKASSVGHATVTPSAILRGIMTAVFWIHPSPTPTVPVATRHEAMLKGIDMLAAAKVLLSPQLIAYRDKYRGGAVSQASHRR
jgi:hypothetical protein